MSYYENIYSLRLNRYGRNYQERIQTKREKQFELYLERSVYRTAFMYDNDIVVGSFEPHRQNETKTLHYLLTPVDVNIPGGTILELPDKDEVNRPWMVYYLENMRASGYNRYIMLRMTHFLTWEGRDKKMHTSWAYMYGQEDNMLKDELQSRSRMDTLYTENLKMSFFVMPKNEFIRKDDYFIIGEKPFQEYYRVTGYDMQSTDGVEFVTVDPVYEYDLTPPPQKTPQDSNEEYYWLEHGVQTEG